MNPKPHSLPSVADFISELTSGGTRIQDEVQGLSVTEMTLDLPIELSVEQSGDRLELRSGPPTQRTATSILPVFHRLKVRISQDPV